MQKTYTMSEEILQENELFTDESEQIWIVAEAPSRDIAEQLADLHTLKGAGFISMLKEITQQRAFTPLENESNIYIIDGMQGDDYENLLNAARKAVEHGYRVFILPNPKGIRTADFIFERKGVYKMFDLKTIQGKSSVMNRLLESVGQTNHVLLNMTTNYRAISLASCIKKYFEINPNSMEILIFKGKKAILVKRNSTGSKDFFKTFTKRYNK